MPTGGASPPPGHRRSPHGSDSTAAIVNGIWSLIAKGLSKRLPHQVSARQDQEEDHLAELQNSWCKYGDAETSFPTDYYVNRDYLVRQSPHLAADNAQLPVHVFSEATPAPPSPFQAAADAPLTDWTQVPPHTPTHSAEALCWGTDLSQRRFSDLSNTMADSQLLSVSSDPFATPTSSLGPISSSPEGCRAVDCSPSLTDDAKFLQRSPSLTGPDATMGHLPSQAASNNMQPSVPSKIHMKLVTAPAAFGQPIGMHKPLNPPFTVQLRLVSEEPMQFKVKLEACLLTAEQLEGIERWNPHTHVSAEGISNGQIEQVLQCQQKGAEDFADTPPVYTGEHRITFQDMRFTSASRMRPRWLVFALLLPNGDALFLQYKAPTIIMSRPCDQQMQASAILSGTLAPPPCKTPHKRGRSAEADDLQSPVPQPGDNKSPDLHPNYLQASGNQPVEAFRLASAPGNLDSAFPRTVPVSALTPLDPNPLMQADPLAKRHKSLDLDNDPLESPGIYEVSLGLDLVWPEDGPYDIGRWHALVMQLSSSLKLGRPLTASDVEVLAVVAKFLDSMHTAAGREAISYEEWSWFGNWFLSQLRIIRHHQSAWDRQQPTLICSFEVDRSAAELFLKGHQPKTFLVRPSLSLRGCVVVSTVANNGRVKHLCLSERQLRDRRLEVWIRDASEAETLLDYKTGQLWPKEKVFLQQYKRLGLVRSVSATKAQQYSSIEEACSISSQLLQAQGDLQLRSFTPPLRHHPRNPLSHSASLQLPQPALDNSFRMFSQYIKPEATLDSSLHTSRQFAMSKCQDVLCNLHETDAAPSSDPTGYAYSQLLDTPEMVSRLPMPNSPPCMVPVLPGNPILDPQIMPPLLQSSPSQCTAFLPVTMDDLSFCSGNVDMPSKRPYPNPLQMGTALTSDPHVYTPPRGYTVTSTHPYNGQLLMSSPCVPSVPLRDPLTPQQDPHCTPQHTPTEAYSELLNPESWNPGHASPDVVANPFATLSSSAQASMEDSHHSQFDDMLAHMRLPQMLDADNIDADMAAHWFDGDISPCSSLRD